MTLPQLILTINNDHKSKNTNKTEKGHQALSIKYIPKNGFAGNLQVVF